MAAPLTSLRGSANVGINWQASNTDPVYGPNSNNAGKAYSLPFNDTGTQAQTANQQITWRETIAANTAVTVDLSAAQTNVCLSANATMVNAIAVQLALLSLADDGTYGQNSNAVRLSIPNSNGLVSFLNAAGTITLSGGNSTIPGDKFGFIASNLNKISIAANAGSITLTNLDLTNQACIEVTLTGRG